MEKLSILFPRQEEVTYREIPEESWHDLGLDAITEKVAAKPQEIPLLRRVMMSLTADPQVAAYRIDVFEDILRHPEIRDRLMKLLEKVRMFYDYGVVNRHMGDETGIWDLMHRLEEYHDYILTVEAIRECLAEKDLISEGLITLRETVNRIYEEKGFEALKKDVEEMRITASEIRSLTVGINVNDRFEAISMGLVSVNGKPFAKSGLLKNFLTAVAPRDEIRKEADWNGSYSYYPANTEVGLLESVQQMAETALVLRNPLAMMSLARIPASDGSANVPRQMDNAASMLTSRIARKLKGNRGGGAAGMEAEGIYNLKLIATEKAGNVVPNDLSFDREKRIYVLTGANRGGKTTVTQAIGQLFLLAQSGIYVPGTRFRFDPADQVLTHFPADEDKTLDLGRLGEECRRFRELYSRCTADSLLLLNETFSTTSFEEGYFIAADAVRAILRIGTRTIYNTHMHKLAQDLDEAINTEEGEGKAVSLVAETKEGRHSFRVMIAPPEGQSFARDIAEKYGVTYERLTGATPS